MYSQEFSHYRRPDVRNVVWFTLQQIDAVRNTAREDEKLNRKAVKVRQIKPAARPVTPDEGAETQNILADARRIVAAAIQSGAAEVHPQPVVRPWQINKGSGRNGSWSPERRRAASLRRQGMKYKKRNRVAQPSTLNPQP
jgi:Cu2+-containing amine oxidase